MASVDLSADRVPGLGDELPFVINTFKTVDFTAPDATTVTYELAERRIDLPVPARPQAGREAAKPASTLTLRLIVRRSPDGHLTPILTNRTDLSAARIAYQMAARWRQENYFKYAREHFALDALDSYADQPDDPTRLVPNPAKTAAADQVSGASAQLVPIALPGRPFRAENGPVVARRCRSSLVR